MTKKRTQDAEIRRRQILDAARMAIRRTPYHELSMDDIARTARISKGLLYLYFKDKEQLFAAVTHDVMASLGERVRKVPKTASPMNDLKAILSDLMAFGEENREFATQFVGEQLAAGKHAESIQMNFKAFLAELGGRIQDCIDAGAMRPHDTEVSGEALIELTKLFMRRKYLLKRLDRPLPTYASEVLDIFMNGFGQRGTPRK
jgi:AcrR family transcriptional regulator